MTSRCDIEKSKVRSLKTRARRIGFWIPGSYEDTESATDAANAVTMLASLSFASLRGAIDFAF
ncbi:hypothetical protein PG990_011477 [Apiospora arundinis]